MSIAALIHKFAELVPAAKLRLLACQVCRRLVSLFPDLELELLIPLGEQRSFGEANNDQLLAMQEQFTRRYNSCYPGFGDPSAAVLALSAAGEVAFTNDDLVAAVNAFDFAAQAIAKLTAETANPKEYDTTYAFAYQQELAVQTKTLMQLAGGLNLPKDTNG